MKKNKEGSGIPHYLATLAQDSENIKMTANNGYVIAPQKIIRCFRVNEIEKLLLLEIISYMGENNYAFPSHKRLAFKLGKKSTATIKNTLISLKDKGFIDWSGGGGDLGTNRYYLKDLFSNPYLIMSEFTHFFAEEILSIHRGEISYEAIYSTILDIVEKPKNMRGEDDSYGICIDWLFKDPSLRDMVDMYWVFGDILHHRISLQSNITINFDTFRLVTEQFKKFQPPLEKGDEDEDENEKDHPILDVLKNPYFDGPFEVKAIGISDDKEEASHHYYNEI